MSARSHLLRGSLSALLLVLTRDASADEPLPRPRYAFEADLTLAYTKVVTAFDKTRDISRQDRGLGLGLALLFRSPYFVSPFVDVSYVQMQRSQQWVDLGPYGGPAVATGSLRAWGVLVGPAFDFWHTRVKAGIGAYDVIVHASVFHDEIRPSELDLGYMFAVTYFPLLVPTGKRDFKVGLEARLGLVTEAALNYVSFGATITEDAIAW